VKENVFGWFVENVARVPDISYTSTSDHELSSNKLNAEIFPTLARAAAAKIKSRHWNYSIYKNGFLESLSRRSVYSRARLHRSICSVNFRAASLRCSRCRQFVICSWHEATERQPLIMLILITMTSNTERLSTNVGSFPRGALPCQAADADHAMTASCQRVLA
jgi:hypothetical protein